MWGAPRADPGPRPEWSGAVPKGSDPLLPAPTATAALRDWQRRDKPSRHDAAISPGHDVGALLNSNRQKFQFMLNQDRIVHFSESECRIRLANGGRDLDLHASLQPEVAGNLLRQSQPHNYSVR